MFNEIACLICLFCWGLQAYSGSSYCTNAYDQISKLSDWLTEYLWCLWICSVSPSSQPTVIMTPWAISPLICVNLEKIVGYGRRHNSYRLCRLQKIPFVNQNIWSSPNWGGRKSSVLQARRVEVLLPIVFIATFLKKGRNTAA